MVSAMLVINFASDTHAAVLMAVSVNTSPGTAAVDLTAQGGVDWAVWHVTGTSGVPGPVAATNRKAVENASISAVKVVGGGNLRGSGMGSWGTKLFTYSDGKSSPASITAQAQSLIFNSGLDTVGGGVEVTIEGDPSQLYEVNIWATGYNGQGTMTASLNGATEVSLVSQEYGSTKAPTLFTFRFQPDSASDQLTLKYVLTAENANVINSHVGIQAITVSAVPEPGRALLGMLALSTLAFKRRRRAGPASSH
jgi:MYXO-CTERM domain-containing protein